MITKKKYKSSDIVVYNHTLREKGIKAYNVKSVVRSALGVGCVVLGAVTSFVPFSSIPLYVVGGGLLGVDIVSLYYSIKKRWKYEIKVYILSATARLKAVFREWVGMLCLFGIRRYKEKW